MTIDLTKITTPFGLLDEETQAQLRAAEKAGMRIAFYGSNSVWIEMHHNFFMENITYRLAPGQVWPKPEPIRKVRYVHLLDDGTTIMQHGKHEGHWGGNYSVVGRARVEVVEGQFDD